MTKRAVMEDPRQHLSSLEWLGIRTFLQLDLP